MPNNIEIDVINDVAHVSIFDNIQEVETEDGTAFEYDYYLLKVVNQPNLEEIIQEDLEVWINHAKENCTNDG